MQEQVNHGFMSSHYEFVIKQEVPLAIISNSAK
jgi:hypothetical protein